MAKHCVNFQRESHHGPTAEASGGSFSLLFLPPFFLRWVLAPHVVLLLFACSRGWRTFQKQNTHIITLPVSFICGVVAAYFAVSLSACRGTPEEGSGDGTAQAGAAG